SLVKSAWRSRLAHSLVRTGSVSSRPEASTLDRMPIASAWSFRANSAVLRAAANPPPRLAGPSSGASRLHDGRQPHQFPRFRQRDQVRIFPTRKTLDAKKYPLIFRILDAKKYPLIFRTMNAKNNRPVAW